MNPTDVRNQTPILGLLARCQQPHDADDDSVNAKPRRPIMRFKKWLLVQRIKRRLLNRSANGTDGGKAVRG